MLRDTERQSPGPSCVLCNHSTSLGTARRRSTAAALMNIRSNTCVAETILKMAHAANKHVLYTWVLYSATGVIHETLLRGSASALAPWPAS